ncbi:hypothetical protein K469DRAFT_735140 [Zopfia rhizophila CBS 207.26]|uniref:Uncharacterized protein n=1 Tax=Zopfia rhizophila CBS 207.26 TaxID=1314779 RepID=A0A6A6EQ16_9PEZI|nr:hypothetical protein K469DRAFT_735140 [Zopfia rhizophila CBS 207.26]
MPDEEGRPVPRPRGSSQSIASHLKSFTYFVSKSLALASLLCSLRSALALPEVTVKPLPDGCSSYPLYHEDSGIAGPWLIQAVSTENTAIEGYTDTDVYSISFNPRTDRKPSLRWGAITFPTRNDIPKRPLQCQNGALHGYVPTDLTAAGAPTSVQWTPLVISPYPYDAELMWKIPEGSPVKAFEHYIGDEKQDGVFLGGYENSTTWGFKYYPANAGSYGSDHYLIRLLGPNSADPTTGNALLANETRGFIKIAA